MVLELPSAQAQSTPLFPYPQGSASPELTPSTSLETRESTGLEAYEVPSLSPNLDLQRLEPPVNVPPSPSLLSPSLDTTGAINSVDMEATPVFQLDLQRVQDMEETGTGTQTSGSPADTTGLNRGTTPSVGSSGSGSQGPTTGSTTGQTRSGSGSGVGTSGHGNGLDGPGSGDSLNAAVSAREPDITGLIVDARGLDFQPSMSMRIFDPEGNQVYTTPTTVAEDLNTYRVATEGTAAYATSEEQARQLIQRIGPRPHHIQAIRTLGYDLVITGEDAWTLRQSNQTDRFLDSYSVVVIWDPNNTQFP